MSERTQAEPISAAGDHLRPAPAAPEQAGPAPLAAEGSAAPPGPAPTHPTARGLRHSQLRVRQRGLGNQAVQRHIQRDGAGLPPVPNYRLTTPGPGAPRAPSLLGPDQRLRLDPQIEAELRAMQIRAALSPAVIQPQLGRLPLGPLRPPPPAPPGPLGPPAPAPAPQPQPAPAPQPRVGEQGEPPREGGAGDVLKAVAERPEVAALLERAGDHAVLQWQQLRLGGQVAVVSVSTLIAGGAIAGIGLAPDARRFVLDQLSGTVLPVPGADWLRAEFSARDDNLMFGLHLDVGRFLPAALGFGPGSPEAMGGPPRLEDAPGPPTLRRAPLRGAYRPRPSPGGRRALQRAPIMRSEPEPTWRDSGNLVGSPPVRDPVRPPNIGIVEDEATYNARRATAEALLARQRARADAMLNADGDVVDERYWFAKVYSFVTEGELEEAAAGTFYYPSYVMQSVRYFEQIYADNVAAADEGRPVEAHWAEAFRIAADNQGATGAEVGGALAGLVGGGLATFGSPVGAVGGAVLGAAAARVHDIAQSLVASMLAHIRFDLPRAEAWVFNSSYSHMPGARIEDFQADFSAMGGIFDRAAQRMNAVIAAQVNLPVDLVPRMLQDAGMAHWFEASMASERADTWQRAELLQSGGLVGPDPYSDAGGALSGDVTAADHASGLAALPPALRPLMDDPADAGSDSATRAQVASSSAADLAAAPASQRARMLRRLSQGATLDDDELTMLSILEASQSAGDVVTVLNMADVWDLAYATDGDEYETLRAFLRKHYFGQAAQSTAVTLLRRCLDGETAEWEEQMVVDILEARADGYTIITQLGAIYEGGGFNEGLNKLEWQLDGDDQDRLEALYGESD